jgi:hypothetical protein
LDLSALRSSGIALEPRRARAPAPAGQIFERLRFDQETHNVIRSFQLDTLAAPKPVVPQADVRYVFSSLRTLRFLLIARAGRVTRQGEAGTCSA